MNYHIEKNYILNGAVLIGCLNSRDTPLIELEITAEGVRCLSSTTISSVRTEDHLAMLADIWARALAERALWAEATQEEGSDDRLFMGTKCQVNHPSFGWIDGKVVGYDEDKDVYVVYTPAPYQYGPYSREYISILPTDEEKTIENLEEIIRSGMCGGKPLKEIAKEIYKAGVEH